MKPLQLLSYREFQRTRARCLSNPSDQHQHKKSLRDCDPAITSHYSVANGRQHDGFNRYIDICPYDRNQLSVGSRYINASWVLERHGGKWWIASQAPLPGTFHAFLSVLMNPVVTPSNLPPTNVRTVVQLTQYTESGFAKADRYFPSTVGQSMQILPESHGSLPILRTTLDQVDYIQSASCTKSTVTVTPENGTPYTFCHLLYDAWPDHGVPTDDNHRTLLAMLHLVEETNRSLSLGDPPIVVGCSAGVGRTGTFIALASLLRAYKVLPSAIYPTSFEVLPASMLGPLDTDDQVVLEVDFLREQRPCMVQRNEQVALIYELVSSQRRPNMSDE